MTAGGVLPLVVALLFAGAAVLLVGLRAWRADRARADERDRFDGTDRAESVAGWLSRERGAVAVEFALLMAAMTPVVIIGTELLIKSVDYTRDYVGCVASLDPGAEWPAVCDRFLPDGVTAPDTVPAGALPPPLDPPPGPVTP